MEARAKLLAERLVTEATVAPRPTLRPPALLVMEEVKDELLTSAMQEEIIGNMTYKCRPAPSIAHADMISAYAGLLITFVMAVYAR